MALNLPRLPGDSRAMLEQAVIDELCMLPNVSELLCGPKPLMLTPPIPFHVVTLEDLPHLIKDTLYGQGLRERQPSGWRFLLMRRGEPSHTSVAYADVRWDERMRTAHFLQVSCGQGASWRAQAIDQAEKTKEAREGEFEVSFLEIPALSFDAVWLQALSSRSHYMVPVGPTYHRLDATQVYPAADLLKRLYEMAIHRASYNTAPEDAMAAEDGLPETLNPVTYMI